MHYHSTLLRSPAFCHSIFTPVGLGVAGGVWVGMWVGGWVGGYLEGWGGVGLGVG